VVEDKLDEVYNYEVAFIKEFFITIKYLHTYLLKAVLPQATKQEVPLKPAMPEQLSVEAEVYNKYNTIVILFIVFSIEY
jgi:hypothetical protein